MKRIISLVLCIVLVFSLCSFLTGCDDRITINVYNVGDYIDEEVITLFEEEYPHIKVNYETFYSNEEMYVKVKNNITSYDVTFPSDYMVERMIAEDLLLKIDFDNLPNYKYIGEEYKNLDYDPTGEYSVPYMWGTMGILYNEDMVDKEDMDSWDAIYNPKYKNKIFMLDSERDMVSITLKSLGYSMNSYDEKELVDAENKLVEQKEIVRAYCGDEVKDKMIAGEAAITLAWSGDAFYCMDYNDSLRYSVPKEGSNLWFDNMVIPKFSKHKKEAELFIDFLCRPDIAKMNTDYIGYSTANAAARDSLPEEIKNDDLRYPDLSKLNNFEIFAYNPELSKRYSKLWQRVKVR